MGKIGSLLFKERTHQSVGLEQVLALSEWIRERV